MANSDFNQKIENLCRQIGEIQQHAANNKVQLEAALPKVIKNLQSILEQLQGYDFEEGVSDHQLRNEITQREQAEEALRQSEKRYKQLIESVTDYTYHVKVENDQPISTDHGPGCVAVTGYMSQEYKANPNLWYQMIHHEDREIVLEQATKVLAREEVVPLEHRIVHKNGSTRWVKNTPVPQYNEQGHLIAYDGLIADITDQKQLEKLLRESETKFRTLAETTTAAIFIFGESRNLYVNPAAEAITGYSVEELLEMKFWDVIHPEFQELVKERGLSRQAGKNIPSRYEVKILTKGGETRWLESTLGSIEFEDKRATIGTAFDITNRKQAETERERLLLAEQEQRIMAETLGEIFLALTSKISHEEVLDEILNQVQRLFPDNATNITLLKDDALRIVRWQGYQAFDRKDVIINLAQPLTELPLDAKVMQSRQPLTISDTRKESNWTTFDGFAWIRSSVSVPICLRDQVLGLLRLDSDTPNQLTVEDTKYLRPLADAAAIALENARLYDQAQQELAERMQAENELRRVTVKQQAILNTIPDSMIYLNRNGKVLDYKLDDHTSLPPGISMPLIIGNSGDTLEANLHDLIKHYIDQTLISSKPQSFEYQLRGPEHVQYFEVRLVASGRNEVLAIMRNISERKRAETALAEERNLLRTVIDNVPDYIFAKDEMGRYLVNNKAHLHLLGVQTPDEATGKSPQHFFSPKEAEQLTSDDQKIFQTGQPLLNKEGLIKSKNGNEMLRSISKVPLRDTQGKIIGLVSIGRDISERRRMEDTLRKSETNLRTILENSQQAFVLANRDRTIQAFNRLAKVGIRLVSGKTIKEGRSVNDYVPEADFDKFRRNFNEALTGRSVRQEKRVNLGNLVKWFEISHNPVFADNGQVIGVCFAAIDIDERKRAVENLAASEMRLWKEMRSMLATTRALVSEININNLLEFIMSQAMALMNAEQAAVLLLGEDGQHLDIANPTESNLGIRKGSHLPIQGSLAGVALSSQQIQISNEVDDPNLLAPMLSFLQLSKVHSLLCAPLTFQRTKLGVLLVWNKRGKTFSVSNDHIMEIFADQAALALYDAELHAQNRLLAIEQERHRMARDLHDSVTQSLYSIGLAAQTSMRLVDQDKVTEAQGPLEYIHTLSQTALAEMREQIFHMHPADLDKEDLVEVLRQHCHTLSKVYNLDMNFRANLELLLPTDQREALYFIAREALWNVIKHAKARRVNITLKSANKGIRLIVEDDGIGLDPLRTQQLDKMGLRNIQQRTGLLKGTFDLQSEPGRGTRLTVQIPH